MAKFDWIPYLQGKYLTYYQWFAVLGSTGLLLLSFLSFVIYLIICKIKNAKPQYQALYNLDINNPEIKKYQKLKTFFFNLTFIFLSMIPLLCSGLDVFYWIQGVIGMFGILALMIFLDNGRQNWSDWGYMGTSAWNKYISICLRITPALKKKLIIVAIISLLANCFVYKTCICFYNEQIGFYIHSVGFGINTYFTRLFQLGVSCPPGKPCQIYATIPQNPQEAFFLNLHTHYKVENVVVYYQQLHTSDPTQFDQVKAQTYDYHGLQWKARRRVHTALIKNLQPDTEYLVKVFYDNQYWVNTIYRTLPSNNSRPIRMINAGDSGYTQAAINLSKIVSTLKPDIFFMGGDVAYDDNMPACAYTWDYFLGMYGKLTATLGYLMPIVVTIGNHDVGLNELPGINITVNNYGPALFIYFPQHYDYNLDGHIVKQVPPLSRRRGVFNFTFANVHYLVLDSGYMHHFDGFQKQFMINSFEANRDKIKFVNYHVPIYSVCESFDRNPERFLYALFHWIPNFDKYKVMTAFENHVHSFKRTKPLIGSNPTENGTVYAGDGAYGAIKEQLCNPDASMHIFDAFSKSNNMWLSTITKDSVHHIAYDSKGNIIDQFTQQVSAYTLQ